MKDVPSLGFASIKQLKELLETRQLSARELVEFFRERFARYDTELGSALEVFSTDSVLERAVDLPSGRLQGIPGLIKDNICMEGRIASCGSRILENYRAPYSATAVTKIMNEGGLLLGRANLDEFAMGSSTETSAFQLTRNPWNLDRVPGGSSGGSIAAVAAGLVPWSLGSETGGSVRQPAALCGIVGSKPTYGLVSRYGLVGYGSSLDQIGVATRTVYDNALVLSVIAGHDQLDSSSHTEKAYDFTRGLTGALPEGLTIGVIDNALYAQGNDPEIVQALETAIEEFVRLGAKIKHITLPTMDYSAATYFIVSRAELASNLARFDGIRYGQRAEDAAGLEAVYTKSRSQGFGEEVKLRILMGNYVLSVGHADAYYQRACTVRELMRAEFKKAFADVDLMLSPVSPIEAFPFNAFKDNQLQLDLQDYFTCAANLVGIPAVSVPCGFTRNRMPIGLQLLGPAFSEALIFQALHAYEQATPWHTMHPEQFGA